MVLHIHHPQPTIPPSPHPPNPPSPHPPIPSPHDPQPSKALGELLRAEVLLLQETFEATPGVHQPHLDGFEEDGPLDALGSRKQMDLLWWIHTIWNI